MSIQKQLLNLLACPECKGRLGYHETDNRLICEACRLSYEIKNDVPVMLAERAQIIGPA